MPRCPICGCLLEPSDLGSFSIDNVWYRERCIPEECDSCSGQMVADNCYRIWARRAIPRVGRLDTAHVQQIRTWAFSERSSGTLYPALAVPIERGRTSNLQKMTLFVLIFLLLGSLILLVACVAGVAAFVGVMTSWYPLSFARSGGGNPLFSPWRCNRGHDCSFCTSNRTGNSKADGAS